VSTHCPALRFSTATCTREPACFRTRRAQVLPVVAARPVIWSAFPREIGALSGSVPSPVLLHNDGRRVLESATGRPIPASSDSRLAALAVSMCEARFSRGSSAGQARFHAGEALAEAVGARKRADRSRPGEPVCDDARIRCNRVFRKKMILPLRLLGCSV
jgi:hypothetical protein